MIAEFTLNMMSEWFVESANHTCGEFDADVDELSLVGLTPVESHKVKPPRVKESAVHMECKLVHTYEVTKMHPSCRQKPILPLSRLIALLWRGMPLELPLDVSAASAFEW